MELMKPLLCALFLLTKSIRKYAKIAGDHRNNLHFCSRKGATEIGDIACEPCGFAHPIFVVSWPALLRMHEKLANGSGSSGVSINGGTPKWMIWNGKSYLVPWIRWYIMYSSFFVLKWPSWRLHPAFRQTHLEDNDSHQKIMTYIRCMCLYVLIYTGEVLVCCG